MSKFLELHNIKTGLILGVLFFLNFTTVKAQGSTSQTKQTLSGVPAQTNIRNAKYPQILPDNRVVFKIKAPQATKVQIDLGKKYDMVKDEDGTWNLTTDVVNKGFNYYSLLIDGVAVADPASESFYGMGRMASGLRFQIKKVIFIPRSVPVCFLVGVSLNAF